MEKEQGKEQAEKQEKFEKKPYYITTPIYYPSANLHIGNTYTTVAADAMARYKRLKGFDVMFLTGTDEHGQKIQRKAEELGLKPIEFVDNIVAGIKDLWELMDISYDRFIRTTEEYHEKAVQKIFTRLYEQGDIYKSEYEGWYCTPCESFWTESQLGEGNTCPDCGRPVEKAKEESYFLRMSKYADRLIEHIETHPHFIQPESRKNEMLNNFLRPGLQDLAVSRTSFDWGVKVPFDPKHVVYVWIDALTNYITALGYENEVHDDLGRYWPADVHLVGKDIIRFHTIYWPIMLMALDLPLPEQVYGHGWLLFDGGKISKSKSSDVIVDPVILSEHFGVDAIRYYLLSEIPFGSDGNFTNETFIKKINADLANDLGNLLSRTTAMVEKYFGGVIPSPDEEGDFDQDLKDTALHTPLEVEKAMDKLKIPEALESIWKLIDRSNKYIDETMPWVLAKDEDKKKRLGTVLYNLTEALRFTGILLQPYLPSTAAKILSQIGSEETSFESLENFGGIKPGGKVTKGEIIFPRIDMEKKITELQELMAEKKKKEEGGSEEKVEEKKFKMEPVKPEITIDDFDKVDLRIVKVTECEPVKGADKLLKLKVDLGGEERQVVSGIAKYFKPEDLIGKKVILVANLKPAKLRGEVSQGMILAVDDEENDKLYLPSPEGDVPTGSTVN